MMSGPEVEAIDSWRFENRVATRAEAVRRLCLVALSVFQTRDQTRSALDGLKELLGGLMREGDSDDDLLDSYESLTGLTDAIGDGAVSLAGLERIMLAAAQPGKIDEAISQTKQTQHMAAEAQARIEAAKAKRAPRSKRDD